MSQLVHELLSDNLYRTERNVLLKENDTCLTHGELEWLSNRFANYLYELGARKGMRISLLLDASNDSVIALVGIMKIGAIYVPINVTAGKEKIAYITTVTESKFLITEAKYAKELVEENSLHGIETIVRGGKSLSGVRSFADYLVFGNEFVPREIVLAKDLINIMFTSGTTGNPKGVMIRHENITPFMNAVTKRFRHNEQTRTLAKTPLSFDPFLTEIVPSFIGGGFVYLYKNVLSINHFLKVLQDEKITNFGCGPSLLLLLADNKGLLGKYDLSNMQQIYFGYENCPVPTIRTLQLHLPHITFINGYGTTETYASSTFHEINYQLPEQSETIPLGEPIYGTELFILNESGVETVQDEIGELIIRGNTIMSGYWKNEVATDEALRINPLFPESMEKVYFTGDLAKRNKNGEILFVGRKDTQVKIQGYRVELSEVQSAIEAHPVVKECCVIAVEQKGSKRLVCYLITAHNNHSEVEAVKSALIAGIERYKIPSEWKLTDAIPRNANSKVDRKALERFYQESICESEV